MKGGREREKEGRKKDVPGMNTKTKRQGRKKRGKAGKGMAEAF